MTTLDQAIAKLEAKRERHKALMDAVNADLKRVEALAKETPFLRTDLFPLSDGGEWLAVGPHNGNKRLLHVVGTENRTIKPILETSAETRLEASKRLAHFVEWLAD